MHLEQSTSELFRPDQEAGGDLPANKGYRPSGPARAVAGSLAVLSLMLEDGRSIEAATHAAEALCVAFRKGHRAFFAGNGGSAAQASHLAAELVGRFAIKDRPGLPAFALSDTAVITATANDFGCNALFSRQVEAFCREGDILFVITASGTSPNILAALNAAKRAGSVTIALCGLEGDLTEADIRIRVPSKDTARIQEGQLVLSHAICDLVEKDMFGSQDDGANMTEQWGQPISGRAGIRADPWLRPCLELIEY